MREQFQPGEPGASTTSLLDRVVALALDEDYAQAAARRGSAAPAHRRPLLWFAVAVLGVLLATAAAQTQRSTPALAAERARLVAEIRTRSQHLQALRHQTSALSSQLQTRQRGLLVLTERSQLATDRAALLGGVSGARPVSGPGVRIVVDDAPFPASGGQRRQVLDVDLQTLVNGLWQAGAEAIAVNGHRLTSLGAIRGAGQAITVDDASLTPPYILDVIGDPDTLPARFLDTAGGQSWQGLHTNLGLRFTLTSTEHATLPADPALDSCCRHAEVAGR